MIVVALFVFAFSIFYVEPTPRIVGWLFYNLDLFPASCSLTLTHSTNFTRILFSIVLWITCVTVLCVTEVCAQSCVTVGKNEIFWPWGGGGVGGGLGDRRRIYKSIGVKAAFNRTLPPQAAQRRPLPELASAPKRREYVSDFGLTSDQQLMVFKKQSDDILVFKSNLTIMKIWPLWWLSSSDVWP